MGLDWCCFVLRCVVCVVCSQGCNQGPCNSRINKPLFINIGVSLVVVGIQTTFGGEHPCGQTGVLLNPGSTLSSSLFLGSARPLKALGHKDRRGCRRLKKPKEHQTNTARKPSRNPKRTSSPTKTSTEQANKTRQKPERNQVEAKRAYNKVSETQKKTEKTQEDPYLFVFFLSPEKKKENKNNRSPSLHRIPPPNFRMSPSC